MRARTFGKRYVQAIAADYILLMRFLHQLLEAMVERPPPRPINLDEFGTETLNGNGTSSSPHPSPQPETEEEKAPTPRRARR